jgi:hypothetical protein
MDHSCKNFDLSLYQKSTENTPPWKLCDIPYEALPWIMWLFADFLVQMRRFDPLPVQAGYVVEKFGNVKEIFSCIFIS